MAAQLKNEIRIDVLEMVTILAKWKRTIVFTTTLAVVAAVERFQIASPQDLLPPGCGPPVR